MLQDWRLKTNRIDFISAYCDGWCERCAYTSRCSAFACQVATAMCGDFEQGLELAVGVPRPVDREPEPVPIWLEELQNIEMTAQDRAELDRQEAARDARIEAAPLTMLATRHMRLAHRWLTAHRDRVSAAADPIIADALAIVAHDCFLVGAKLRRAQDGRDRSRHGAERLERLREGRADLTRPVRSRVACDFSGDPRSACGKAHPGPARSPACRRRRIPQRHVVRSTWIR